MGYFTRFESIPDARPAEPSLSEADAQLFVLRRGAYLRGGKRAIDLAGALLGLIIAAPAMVLIAAAIAISMGRPVIIRQRRLGRYNATFTLFKFRTMDRDRREEQMPFIGGDRRRVHKSANDPRITSLGGWLRATRFDELPQLFNVVKGDLSLVGPRPELLEVATAHYEPWQYRRHAVKPGLTGIWQVSDMGEQRLHDCTEMELVYLDEVSLATDLKIILKTIPAMIRKRGI